jgi:uncharacterized membrane protein YphA (DoxX/SURF4 family)
VLRTAIGLLFVGAGLLKLLRPEDFRGTLAAFGFLAESQARWIAPGVAGLETLLGALFLLGFVPALVGRALLAVVVVFSAVAVTGMLGSGAAVDCGCLPGLDGPGGPAALLIRNLLLVAGIWFVVSRSEAGASAPADLGTNSS